MNWEEACKVLGINETVSPTEIYDQYIYKVQLLHPDKNQDKPEKIRLRAEEELKKVNQAYNFLKQPNNNPYNNPPKVQVTPDHIRFKDMKKGENKKTSFVINSIGGPYTNIWIDNQPADWLSVVSVKSLSSEEQLPLEVTIEAIGVGQPGEKTSCKLLIKIENNNTKQINEEAVVIQLWRRVKPAKISYELEDSNFEDMEIGQIYNGILRIINSGGERLIGNISINKKWLSIQPIDFDIAPFSKKEHNIKVNTKIFPKEIDSNCEIVLNSNGGNLVIPFDITDKNESNAIKKGKQINSSQQEEQFSRDQFWGTFGTFFFVGITFLLPIWVWLAQIDGLAFGIIIYLLIAIFTANFKAYK